MNNKLKLKSTMLACVICTPLLLNGCVAALIGAGAATTGAVVASDSRTVEAMFYDDQIEQNASNILKDNKLLSDDSVFRVSVIAVAGNVLLVGQTTNTQYLQWCISKIKSLDYVRNVYNYVSNKKPVSASVMASDSYITTKVKSKLLFGENIKSGRFKVVTEDSCVYLMGLVTKDESVRASNLTRSVDGVKKIYTIFDYLDYPDQYKQGYKDEKLNVVVVDATQGTKPSSVAAPASQVNTVPSNQSSSYIAPASSSDNGGALLMEDTDLLAPASNY